MPYTISHAAVAVPISRLLLRMRMLSAVIIGSVVPDYGYLMPIHPPRLETHSLSALGTFCLPVGLLSYWIFQWVIKLPLLSILPNAAYLRWRPYSKRASPGSWREWLLAAAGVLVGAVTHLAWDGFTHEDARGVRMVPELADMFEVRGHVLTGARLLQGLSSMIGLLVVVAAIIYALRGTRGGGPAVARALSSFERRSWGVAYLLATLGCCIAFAILDKDQGGYRWLGLSSIAIALLRAMVAALLGVSLALTAYLRTKR